MPQAEDEATLRQTTSDAAATADRLGKSASNDGGSSTSETALPGAASTADPQAGKDRSQFSSSAPLASSAPTDTSDPMRRDNNVGEPASLKIALLLAARRCGRDSVLARERGSLYSAHSSLEQLHAADDRSEASFFDFLHTELNPEPLYPTPDAIWGQTERQRV